MLWSEWKEYFAWYPTKVILRDYKSINNITYSTDPIYKWIWLKRYFRRERISPYFKSDTYYPIEYDYALNIIDLLRKA
jgi:hypothetical protein